MGAEARAEFSGGTDLGHSKKVQKVMPDRPSRMNTSREIAASRMPLSPRA